MKRAMKNLHNTIYHMPLFCLKYNMFLTCLAFDSRSFFLNILLKTCHTIRYVFHDPVRVMSKNTFKGNALEILFNISFLRVSYHHIKLSRLNTKRNHIGARPTLFDFGLIVYILKQQWLN